jgi:hypothetical protein
MIQNHVKTNILVIEAIKLVDIANGVLDVVAYVSKVDDMR